MRNLKIFAAAVPLLLAMTSGAALALDKTEEDYELKLLGKYVFFDKISVPARMACATCHTPDVGWTFGVSGTNMKDVAITGANPHTVGSLKPPSNAYASFIMDFESPCVSLPAPAIPSGVCGGNFWNGRAKGDAVREINSRTDVVPLGTGWEKYLGAIADQAHASPFINPVEQGVANITDVCGIVQRGQYAPLFFEVYNEPIDCSVGGVERTFARFALALSAYQHSKDVNAFASRRDLALANDADGKFPLDDFTAQENLGHDLFYNTRLFGPPPSPQLPVTNCSFCHNSSGFPVPQGGPPFGNLTPVNQLGTDPFELYTDMAYHNIGTPRNFEIPGSPPESAGLAETSGNPGHVGGQKTPTLRNVDKRRGAGFKKSYTHNGWFKSLESIVHFYNTSAVAGSTAASFGITRCPDGVVTEKDALVQNCWPAPGAGGPLLSIGLLIGDMGMTLEQEAALVAYLKTLTDVPTPRQPEPFNMTKFQAGQLQ